MPEFAAVSRQLGCYQTIIFSVKVKKERERGKFSDDPGRSSSTSIAASA
jgi:hypothetical protein